MQRTSVNPDDVFDSTRYGFAQAVVTEGGKLVHVSGQVGWDSNERPVGDTLEEQTTGAFDNLERVLRAAGGSLADVTSLRIYVVAAAADDTAPVARALLSRFSPEQQPAATWITVSGLAGEGLLIEVEATAVVAAP